MAPKRKIVAIVNPFSGISNKANIRARLSAAFEESAFDFEVYETKYAGHARQLSTQAVEAGAETVIAVGGDGSVNEVSSALVDTGVKLGVLSMGSGNGFARHLGLHRSIQSAIDKIKEGKVVSIDTARVNGQHFVNVSGIGFDALIAANTKKSKLRGLGRYLMTSFSSIHKATPFEAEICTEHSCTTGLYKNIVIANGPLYGFNFSIAPDATMEDGMLDVMLFEEAPLYRYLLALPKFTSGQLATCSFVQHIRSTQIMVRTQEPLFMHVDGEGFSPIEGDSPYSFEYVIKPQSLQVIV